MHHRDVTDPPLLCPSRRGVVRSLAGVGVTTVAAGVLVACGGTTGSTAAGGTDGLEAGGSATGGTTAEAAVPLADVPVGEAVVVDALGTRFVLARPSAGEVVAFSATCTHAGTQVEATGSLEVLCPNHGSRFDAGDGAAVSNGPAESPLPPAQARVEGDQVVLSA